MCRRRALAEALGLLQPVALGKDFKMRLIRAPTASMSASRRPFSTVASRAARGLGEADLHLIWPSFCHP